MREHIQHKRLFCADFDRLSFDILIAQNKAVKKQGILENIPISWYKKHKISPKMGIFFFVETFYFCTME